VLAHAFLRRYGAENGVPKRGFTPDALAAIEAHPWPGNVRELENKVKTAVIMSEGPLVTADDLGLAGGSADGLLFNLKEVRARAERAAINQAMAVTDGNISKAADLLGVSRPTLYDLMERYGMRRAEEGG
jgi:two-component system NtrC family response regulator